MKKTIKKIKINSKITCRYLQQLYSDKLQSLLKRAYGSIERCLNSPPKLPGFTSLPVQSDFINRFKGAIFRYINTFLNKKNLLRIPFFIIAGVICWFIKKNKHIIDLDWSTVPA